MVLICYNRDTLRITVSTIINKEHLAIRRTFSLVDMITNTKFSNCPNVFEIGVVWQQNMYSRQQNMFQSDSPFTISCKRALSTPPLI